MFCVGESSESESVVGESVFDGFVAAVASLSGLAEVGWVLSFEVEVDEVEAF